MCHPPSPEGHPLGLSRLLPESTPLRGGRTLRRGLRGSQEQAHVHLSRDSWGLGYPESDLELWALGSRAHLPNPTDPCPMRGGRRVWGKAGKDPLNHLRMVPLHLV